MGASAGSCGAWEMTFQSGGRAHTFHICPLHVTELGSVSCDSRGVRTGLGGFDDYGCGLVCGGAVGLVGGSLSVAGCVSYGEALVAASAAGMMTFKYGGKDQTFDISALHITEGGPSRVDPRCIMNGGSFDRGGKRSAGGGGLLGGGLWTVGLFLPGRILRGVGGPRGFPSRRDDTRNTGGFTPGRIM